MAVIWTMEIHFHQSSRKLRDLTQIWRYGWAIAYSKDQLFSSANNLRPSTHHHLSSSLKIILIQILLKLFFFCSCCCNCESLRKSDDDFFAEKVAEAAELYTSWGHLWWWIAIVGQHIKLLLVWIEARVCLGSCCENLREMEISTISCTFGSICFGQQINRMMMMWEEVLMRVRGQWAFSFII